VYPEIDIVTTPAGEPVAMVHCNNFLSDIDAWVKLLGAAAASLGAAFDADKLYGTLYALALEGDANCGGLVANNYISGEHVTGFTEGRPLFIRMPEARFSLPNFMRAQLYSACASLRIGMDILFEEQVKLDSIMGHGGFFKVPVVGQRIMAAALGTTVNVMTTAGEGGPWGMAVLAAYMMNKQGTALADYLSAVVFAGAKCAAVEPDPADAAGFAAFMERYKASLAVERAAVRALRARED
jgi:sugar (pentulose or hexulose) kinase